jgi:flavin reductase (DIM6/NTAB) family NADH-FMN oxidoreductase RutF
VSGSSAGGASGSRFLAISARRMARMSRFSLCLAAGMAKSPRAHHLSCGAGNDPPRFGERTLLDKVAKSPDPSTTIHSLQYRDAMSHFAGAVTIATTDGPAGRRGVTVSAAVSASDNPPTLMVCLNRNREENRWFAANGCFAINVLNDSHLALAEAFAGVGHLAMAQRFAIGAWGRLRTGAPVLKDSRVTLDCVVRGVQTVHTHDVLFGEVVATSDPKAGRALAYLERRYTAI